MPEKSNTVVDIKTELYDLETKPEVTQSSHRIDVYLTDGTSQICSKACLESFVQLETVTAGKKSNDSILIDNSIQTGHVSKDENPLNETLIFDTGLKREHYVKKDFKVLASYSLRKIKDLAKELSLAVEDVSSQLVQLLQENDALQQESDARNVAIEQLLRLTVKETENELKPVQMSVIMSDEDI